MSNITLYGISISPFVRKVVLALRFKNVDFEVVPVVPRSEDQPAEFKENSPLGKIPLLRVGDQYIADSSVICAWIERAYPTPALLPENDLAAARALWFETYADGVMQPSVGGHLFAEVVLAKPLFKREPIQADIDLAMNVELPAIFTYLESQLTDDYLVGSSMTFADIAVGNGFIAMHLSDVACDPAQWPKTAAYIDRVFNTDLFQNMIAESKQLLASLV